MVYTVLILSLPVFALILALWVTFMLMSEVKCVMFGVFEEETMTSIGYISDCSYGGLRTQI